MKLNYIGVDYNDATLSLQRAIAGEGIAMTRRSLVGDDIANGSLVQLFKFDAPSPHSYNLVCLPQYAASPKVRLFRDWLMAEIDWE